MLIETITVGPFAMNCYVLACEETREGVVIDPGDEISRITGAIDASAVRIRYILLTHAHLDHIGAVEAMKHHCNVGICLHPDDLPLYESLPEHGRMFGLRYSAPPPVDHYLQEGEEIHFGKVRLTVCHTPGHSPGGVSFCTDGVVMVGDVLFAGSIGRTDLPGGSYPVLLQSIRSRLLTLDDETMVYPGHGPATTIGEERRSNPFLQPGFVLG